VADEHGRLVNDLRPGSVQILDNRYVVDRIREFSSLRDLPLQIGMLIDVSDSVRKTIVREKLASQLFVQQVLRPESDNAFLMSVGSETKLWQTFTADRAALARALEHMQQRGIVTNLYDGLFVACSGQFPDYSDRPVAQRVLVLFSDGVDTGSLHALADVIAVAQHNDIQLYAVSVHSRRLTARGDRALISAAEQTGGQFYIADSEKDFPAIFAAMEQQMRTQYSVSFQPTEQTPGFHSVRLEIAGPQKLQVRARQGYYFAAP
jgi:VWFA-related protein